MKLKSYSTKNSDGSERLRADWLVTSVGLAMLGLLLVAVSTPERLFAHLGWLAAGATGAWIAGRGGFDPRPGMPALLLGSLVVGLVCGFVAPQAYRSWNAAIAPALTGLFGVVWLSSRFSARGRAGYGAVLVIVVCALGVQRNVAAAVGVGATGLLLLRCAGARLGALGLGACATLSALLMLWMRDPLFVRRMMNLSHAFYSEERAVPLTVRAIRGGGWFGGHESESLLLRYAPRDATGEFAGALMIERWGVATLMLAGLAFVMLLVAAWRIQRAAQHPASRLAAIAAGAWLIVPAVWHLVGILQVIPFRGVALPLVSHDGPMLVTSLIAVGLLAFASTREPAPC